MNDYLGNLTTESVNEKTKHIDECSHDNRDPYADQWRRLLVAGAVKGDDS